MVNNCSSHPTRVVRLNCVAVLSVVVSVKSPTSQAPLSVLVLVVGPWTVVRPSAAVVCSAVVPPSLDDCSAQSVVSSNVIPHVVGVKLISCVVSSLVSLSGSS